MAYLHGYHRGDRNLSEQFDFPIQLQILQPHQQHRQSQPLIESNNVVPTISPAKFGRTRSESPPRTARALSTYPADETSSQLGRQVNLTIDATIICPSGPSSAPATAPYTTLADVALGANPELAQTSPTSVFPLDPSLQDAVGEPVPESSQQSSPAMSQYSPRAFALWPLQTSDLLADTQLESSLGETPNTPELPYAHDNPVSSSNSLQASTTDAGSYYSNGGNSGPHSQWSPQSPMEDAVRVPLPKQKKSHARKQPEGHIKRARNAFILFRKHITDSGLIPASVEVKHQNISVVVAKMWREAPQDVRAKFQEQARLEKEEHQRKYPGYRYQPVFRRTDIIRRRVRKDPAEDDKVEAVAEALIQGKVGHALEQEICTQMKERSEDLESDSDRGSRRRRRDVGQLSKGAIRAQRAQNRAKQIRQSLLSSSLLNMQHMYGADAMGQHGSLHLDQQHLQYGISPTGSVADHYIPVGYNQDGRPVIPGYHAYCQDIYTDNAYHLSPLQSQGMADMDTSSGLRHEMHLQHPAEVATVWGSGAPDTDHAYNFWPGAREYNITPSGPSHDYYTDVAGEYIDTEDYRLPPLINAGRNSPVNFDMGVSVGMGAGGHSKPIDQVNGNHPVDIIAGHYGRNHTDKEVSHGPQFGGGSNCDVQQTPSGHVIFNELLFEGALGSATLRREEDDLSNFDEAVIQATDMAGW